MNFKLLGQQDLLVGLGIENVPSNIDMFYSLAYKMSTCIFEYRKDKNLTQTQLARILEVNQAMVSKLESGSYNISLETLCNVFSKLGIKIDMSFESFSFKLKDASELNVTSEFLTQENNLLGGAA